MGHFLEHRIRDARIMVVGCGALGNEVLKNLALAGAGHLVLVDFDQVEESNLTRSILFRREDALAGCRKVDVAARRLREINPAIQVTTIFGDVAYDVGLGYFADADVVIGCVDSRWGRYCINRLCMRAGTPWVDGAIEGLQGTARVFAPGKNCYACNLGPVGLEELRRRMPCSGVIRREERAGHVPTTAVAASIIGAVQVQEAMKIIDPDSVADASAVSLLGRMFHYDGACTTARTADFAAFDDDCPVHEVWGPVSDSPLTAGSTVAQTLEFLRSQAASSRDGDVSFFLHDDCFVDFVEAADGSLRVEAMLPGRRVEAFASERELLRGYLLSELTQNEYRRIDASFPYAGLSLGSLGIPPFDILKARILNDTCYYRMKG